MVGISRSEIFFCGFYFSLFEILFALGSAGLRSFSGSFLIQAGQIQGLMQMDSREPRSVAQHSFAWFKHFYKPWAFFGGPFGDDFIFFNSLFGMILGFFQTSQTNPSWHYWGLRTKGYKEMIFGNP